MVFFRIKKVKEKEYAYLVENEWKSGTSRQKVKGYLGRAYKFNLKNDIDFRQFIKTDDIKNCIEGNDYIKIISDLVEWELFKFNVDRSVFSIDFANRKIQKNKKDVALLINEGFMCSLTLKNLFEFKLGNDETDVYRFARAFVEAGIKVPQEAFVNLFEKLYKSAEKPKSEFVW